MKNKILVCGGAGYIGSHCVRMLLEKEYEVVVVDNLSTGHLEAVNPKAKFYQGDVRDEEFLNEVFQANHIDAVIHFCAKSLVGESMEKPLEYFDNNVNGTLVLLQAMVKAGVKKIVFSSSAAVYGEHMQMPIDETFATEPTNPYGETKLAMEKIMKWADWAYGLKYISLRYFNVAGADFSGEIGEDHNPESHLIPIVLQAALGKRPFISVYGTDYPTKDGTCIRDYIHVVDLINAHILSLEALLQGHDSDVFNLGSEDGYSVLEIIEAAKKITEVDFKVKIGERRQGDPAKLIASSKKIKEALGWKAEYGIEDIIKSAYEFHKNHPNGY
jgi:UDP-glucose 4-epimerase